MKDKKKERKGDSNFVQSVYETSMFGKWKERERGRDRERKTNRRGRKQQVVVMILLIGTNLIFKARVISLNDC